MNKIQDIDFAIKYWEKWLNQSNNNYISLYTHIPWCISNCKFCIYKIDEAVPTTKQLDSYLLNTERIALQYRNIFKDIKFKSLYCGGGSPSILRPEQLQTFFNIIYENFNFDINKEYYRSFEVTSYLMNDRKIEILIKNHINRFSFGVQSFNKKISDLNNRPYATFNRIKSLLDLTKDYYTNIDLMIGIGNDLEIIIDDFNMALELNPNRITLYANRLFHEENSEYFEKYVVSIIKSLNEIAQKFEYKNIDNQEKYLENNCWVKSNKTLLYPYQSSSKLHAIIGLGHKALSDNMVSGFALRQINDKFHILSALR